MGEESTSQSTVLGWHVTLCTPVSTYPALLSPSHPERRDKRRRGHQFFPSLKRLLFLKTSSRLPTPCSEPLSEREKQRTDGPLQTALPKIIRVVSFVVWHHFVSFPSFRFQSPLRGWTSFETHVVQGRYLAKSVEVCWWL